MSEFWNNNKDTIGAGLKTVGKYSYKSTKFVAKTGYQAGKSHYQNSKAKGREEAKKAAMIVDRPLQMFILTTKIHLHSHHHQ